MNELSVYERAYLLFDIKWFYIVLICSVEYLSILVDTWDAKASIGISKHSNRTNQHNIVLEYILYKRII